MLRTGIPFVSCLTMVSEILVLPGAYGLGETMTWLGCVVVTLLIAYLLPWTMCILLFTLVRHRMRP